MFIRKVSCVFTAAAILSSPLFAGKDFIFSENPAHQNVKIQNVNYLFPSRLLTSRDSYGQSVTMDDGSVWSIDDPISVQAVQSWYVNDSLIICSNHPTYVGAPRFFIYNQMTKTTAFANPKIKPIYGRVTSNTIYQLDYYTRNMQTIDGAGRVSYWLVDYNNNQTLQYWKKSDLIVIGYNQNYTNRPGSSLPYLLINMDRGEFVHAQLL